MANNPQMPVTPTRKPKGTVFEALMFVAVAATIGAIVLLILSLNRYGWQMPT